MSTTPPAIVITWRITGRGTTGDIGDSGHADTEYGEIALHIPQRTAEHDGPETGDAGPATISIETDPITAAEIREGSLSPQHALLLGRIVVSADPVTLLAASAAIASSSTDA